MVMNLYERGDITKEQLKNHPKKNIITRAVGVAQDVEPDYFESELPKGAAVLLCFGRTVKLLRRGRYFQDSEGSSPRGSASCAC